MNKIHICRQAFKLRNEVPCSNRGKKAAQINAGFLKEVSSTLLGTQLPAEFSTTSTH
ncbi:hypothetical protein DPMN_070405 [Dreissena polymorpha]|uniref:Uncharacterized protein n=1 Tax=Dreissena polymorpha TaxID=45954 RepID=A0A9D3Z5W3_DREPO|nr:hypothetical protein DPMN_070405 [Dreissena polymorpha]